MNGQIATANRLSDGGVVFLGYDGEWTVDVDAARVSQQDEDANELVVEAEQSPEAVGAYLIDVDVSADEADGRRVVPTKYRERIRAFGPSIHPAFAKAKVAGHFDPRTDVSGVFINGL